MIMVLSLTTFFFFSSRRRHTRWTGDWSSDVCSSDLIAGTLACLGGGYWLVHRSRKVACADGDACTRPLPNRIVKTALIFATILVIGALGLDFLAPLLLR